MKKLIITSFLSLITVVCFSQDIYKIKVNSLEVGRFVDDSTYSWNDSVLVNPHVITIYQDSLTICDGVKLTSYKLLKKKESNPGINTFKSVEILSNQSYDVTFFTSECLDKTLITVIIKSNKKSYNFLGKII